MAITVVGLGPGPADLLSVRSERVLRHARRLVLRTERHPMAGVLREWGVSFTTLDSFYERYADFEEMYAAMAHALLAQAEEGGSEGGGLVYAVPGHPLVGERSVVILLEQARARGVRVEVAVSPGAVESTWAELGVDPMDAGVALIDAHEVARGEATPQLLPPARGRAWERDRAYLILQVDSAVLASQVKMTVAQVRGDHQMVALVRQAGGQGAVEWVPLHDIDRGRVFDHETSIYVPPARVDTPPGAGEGIEVLRRVMAALRAPRGCPWDRRQTPDSLRRYVLEEAYEVCDAIERGDRDDLQEELGDLLLQVLFQAQIADEEGAFDLAGVEEHLRAKLVRRHPHVFGDTVARTPSEVLERWEAIKQEERAEKAGRAGEPNGARDSSLMDEVAPGLPALLFAHAVQRKAATIGFEWPDIGGAGSKAVEEAHELRRAWAEQDPEAVYREFGDLLFALVNVARYMKVDPELALRDATHRFVARFREMERMAREAGGPLGQMSLEAMDELWERAKRLLATTRRSTDPEPPDAAGTTSRGGEKPPR